MLRAHNCTALCGFGITNVIAPPCCESEALARARVNVCLMGVVARRMCFTLAVSELRCGAWRSSCRGKRPGMIRGARSGSRRECSGALGDESAVLVGDEGEGGVGVCFCGWSECGRLVRRRGFVVSADRGRGVCGARGGGLAAGGRGLVRLRWVFRWFGRRRSRRRRRGRLWRRRDRGGGWRGDVGDAGSCEVADAAWD